MTIFHVRNTELCGPFLHFVLFYLFIYLFNYSLIYLFTQLFIYLFILLLSLFVFFFFFLQTTVIAVLPGKAHCTVRISQMIPFPDGSDNYMLIYLKKKKKVIADDVLINAVEIYMENCLNQANIWT